MKAELRSVPHAIVPGATAVEVWHDGEMIAAIYGGDGPSVRVVTKHGVRVDVAADLPPRVVEITICRR